MNVYKARRNEKSTKGEEKGTAKYKNIRLDVIDRRLRPPR